MESGNTHFSLCQKFSCFHKHYTPMMRFSNSRLNKAYMFYKRYAIVSGHMHTKPNIWMKNQKTVRITLERAAPSIPGFLFLPTVSALVLEPRTQLGLVPSAWLLPHPQSGQPCPGLWFWHPHQGPGKEPPPIPPLVHLSSRRKRFANPATLHRAWDTGTARKMQFPFSQSLGHTPRREPM